MNEFMSIQRIGYASTIVDVILDIYARKIVTREEQVMMLLQEYNEIPTELRETFKFDIMKSLQSTNITWPAFVKLDGPKFTFLR